MKILHVSNFFKPSWEGGGPIRIVYETSKKMHEHGHDVTVYTTDGFQKCLNVKKNAPIELEGLQVYYFKNVSFFLSKNFALPIPLLFPFVIKKEIGEFDIIFIHEFRGFLAAITVYYAKKNGIPYFVYPHGSIPKGGGVKKILKDIFDKIYGYSMLKNATQIIAQNDHEIEECKHYLGNNDCKKILLIPLGVNLSEFIPVPPNGYLREKFHLKKDDKIILVLCRISKQKGIQLVVKTFYNINKENKNYKLIIVGNDDGYLSDLKQLINTLGIGHSVFLPGPLFERDRIAAYVDADVFVLTPNHYEETSLAVLEACATGVPVIITHQNNVPYLQEYNAGYVIDYNQKQLEDCLIQLLSDNELRKTMGKNAKKLIAEKFDIDIIIKLLEKYMAACTHLNISHK
ncbi:MAG: glycosyltransferase [Methanoregula sp.]